MKQAPAKFRFAAVAVDSVLFGFAPDGELVVLVDTINRPPHYDGMKGFPGGMILEQENAEQSVRRILTGKVACVPEYLEQLYTFSGVERDKRNRVVSIAYFGCVRPNVVETYQHSTAQFVPVSTLRHLAYDHDEMLDVARRRLAAKLAYTTIAQFLLPRYFTLTHLQTVYERISRRQFDKRNFRKKIFALGILKETGRREEGVQNRPAALYTFVKQKLTELPLGL